MKKNGSWPKIMLDNTIKAVHDDDLVSLLKSLDVYDAIISRELKCCYCGINICLDNILAILPIADKIEICCDKPECRMILMGLKNVEVK